MGFRWMTKSLCADIIRHGGKRQAGREEGRGTRKRSREEEREGRVAETE